jgi:transcriptional regulator with XRE-family HTH domain
MKAQSKAGGIGQMNQLKSQPPTINSSQHLPETWRELLKRLITHPAEKQRIADELGVSTLTLTRWASGEYDPQLKSLRRLHEVVPQQFQRMMSELIQAEIVPAIPLRVHSSNAESHPDIPSAFYYRVLALWATSRGPFRAYQLRKLVLQQAIKLLDPDILGLRITLAHYVPPKPSNKIRSLVEVMEVHTPPYEGKIGSRLHFLGSESLPGYVTAQGFPAVINEMDQQAVPPITPCEHEQSAAAYPILSGGAYAGCLHAFCTQKHYFSEARLSLLEASAYLMALSFQQEDFVSLDQVALREMPRFSPEEEHTLMLQFRDRVRLLQGSQPLSIQQAEREALQQIEEELFNERGR